MEKISQDRRIRELETRSISPFVVAFDETRQGRPEFLRYLLSQTNYPLALYSHANAGSSFLESTTYNDLNTLDFDALDMIIKYRPFYKTDVLKHVYFNAEDNFDVERAQWAINNGFPIQKNTIALWAMLSRYAKDIPLLKFYTDLGLIKGYIDLHTRDLVETKKALIAYKDPQFEYPRYPLTQRPRVNMKAGNKCSPNGEYLPVVRYEGLYYSGMPSIGKECGVFYFYEPQSSTLLELGNYLIAANKVHAYALLKKLKSTSLPEKKLELIFSSYPFRDSKDEPSLTREEYDTTFKFMTTLLETPDEVMTNLITYEQSLRTAKTYDFKDRKGNLITGKLDGLFQTQNGYYIGGEYYSKSDFLDQIICVEAFKQGYDTIILQREIGEQRVVTEILDTRSREESYNSLCSGWEVDLNPNKKYPAIWFVDQGFVNIA